MATFQTHSFIKHDDYMTPKTTWEDIKQYIPTEKVIWEAFWGDGKSGEYLTEMGFNVIHEKVDFFKNDFGEIVVSNPPFSQIPQILKRLKELNKPFILIMPSSKINTQYFRNIFSEAEDRIQIIIPKKRINFEKHVDGKVPDGWLDRCNFDCFYYCWKVNLERDIIFA